MHDFFILYFPGMFPSGWVTLAYGPKESVTRHLQTASIPDEESGNRLCS